MNVVAELLQHFFNDWLFARKNLKTLKRNAAKRFSTFYFFTSKKWQGYRILLWQMVNLRKS
ncbi:hypothetical protein FLA_5343 [Filimonas lacunae]|nr:hypothetical protein FLA_5343 [Filimonas lacunae]